MSVSERDSTILYREDDSPLTADEEEAIQEKLDWIPSSAFDNGYYYVWFKEDTSRLLNAYRKLRAQVDSQS